ncbi:MAG: nucleotidyltransferase domain-containing protein [Armatimonadetes bacterium]|nr:nucleotidyltransferase domain-containing protein [Armatimonadota bacterium]
MGEGTPALGTSAAHADAEVRQFLDEWLGAICAHFAPEAVLLFGSRAAGTADEWSDIDVVVVSRRFEGLGVFDRFRIFDEVVQPHWHVDVLCLTPEEFERRREGPNIIAEAVRTGVRIV